MGCIRSSNLDEGLNFHNRIEVDEKGIRVNRIEVGLMVSSIGIGIGIEGGGVGEFEFNVQGFNSREFEIQLQSQRV